MSRIEMNRSHATYSFPPDFVRNHTLSPFRILRAYIYRADRAIKYLSKWALVHEWDETWKNVTSPSYFGWRVQRHMAMMAVYIMYNNVLIYNIRQYFTRVNVHTKYTRGKGEGEGRGVIAPPPLILFRSFFCTRRNLSEHVNRQACHLYRQIIWSTNKILTEIAVLECENAKIA